MSAVEDMCADCYPGPLASDHCHYCGTLASDLCADSSRRGMWTAATLVHLPQISVLTATGEVWEVPLPRYTHLRYGRSRLQATFRDLFAATASNCNSQLYPDWILGHHGHPTGSIEADPWPRFQQHPANQGRPFSRQKQLKSYPRDNKWNAINKKPETLKSRTWFLWPLKM